MRQNSNIPKERGFDNTLNILKDGYLFQIE